jgi:ATP-dependent helicase/nuclease subunit A
VLDASNDDEADTDDRLNKDETEAAFVAGKIYELIEQNPSIKYSGIAILLRSYSNLHYYEKHLRRLNVPYSSDHIGNLFADAPANDLVRLLRLVVYPADTDAYAAVLRSPLVGLSYASLTACLSFHKEQKERVFGDDVPLAGTERERYEKGQRLYRRVCEKSRGLSVCEMLTDVWYAEGYRYETMWNSAVAPYREIYDYLFEIAHKIDIDADGGGLTGFVDALSRLQNNDEKLDDIEIPLERAEAVRILSVHKSKGLEFPVVFLCGAGAWSRRESADLVYLTGEGSPHGKRVGIKPPMPDELLGEKHLKEIKSSYFFEAGAEENRAERRAELRRLLYVALTRAEKMLYITGNFPLGKADDEGGDCCPLTLRLKHAVEEKLAKQIEERPDLAGDAILDNDTFFGMFLPAYTAHIADDGTFPPGSFPGLEAIPHLTQSDIRTSTRHSALNEVLARIAPLYQTASVVETPVLRSNRTTPTQLAGAVTMAQGLDKLPTPDLDYTPLSPTDFGTLAHACVEALFDNRTPIVPPQIAAQLSPSRQKVLLAIGMEMAKQFAASPLGEAAQNAAWRKNEYAFRSRIVRADGTANGYGLFIDGTIDLLFDDGGMVNVVDFKTDAVENPSEHLAQMACYYHAASVMRGKPCRVWLYYLRTGNAVEVTKDVRGNDEVFTRFP